MTLSIVAILISIGALVFSALQWVAARDTLALQRTPALSMVCQRHELGKLIAGEGAKFPSPALNWSEADAAIGPIIKGDLRVPTRGIRCALRNLGSSPVTKVEVAFEFAYFRGDSYPPPDGRIYRKLATAHPGTLAANGASELQYVFTNMMPANVRIGFPVMAQLVVPPDSRRITVPIELNDEAVAGIIFLNAGTIRMVPHYPKGFSWPDSSPAHTTPPFHKKAR